MLLNAEVIDQANLVLLEVHEELLLLLEKLVYVLLPLFDRQGVYDFLQVVYGDVFLLKTVQRVEELLDVDVPLVHVLHQVMQDAGIDQLLVGVHTRGLVELVADFRQEFAVFLFFLLRFHET